MFTAECSDYFVNIGSHSVFSNDGDILWKGPKSGYPFLFGSIPQQTVLSCLKLLPDRSYTAVIGIDDT